METFYKDGKFIIAFLVIVLFVNMAFGEKFSEKFMILVIAGMLIFNVQDFANFLSGIFPASEQK